MRRVALETLAHDRLRTSMVVVGLGAIGALVVVQTGLERGFERSARTILDRVGGDLWVTAQGVRVVDDGEPVTLPATSDPCVVQTRPVIVDYAQVRRPDRSLVTVQIVATEGAATALDEADVEKLGVARAAGAELELRGGRRLRIDSYTQGVRSFTQTPFLFVDIATARETLGLPEGTASFWVVDARDAACTARLETTLADEGHVVRRRDAFARSTVIHWIEGSGIGTLLSAGSVMAAIVGALALVQSALGIVRTHVRELATVRALGARRSELAAFVGWQVGVIATLSTLLALGLATGLARSLGGAGLLVVVDGRTWAGGLAIAIASTCAAATIAARVLGRIDPRAALE